MTRPTAPAWALLVLALLAGCGSPKTVDTTEIESQIKTQLSTGSVTVTSAKCPDDVEVKQGATFTCTVYFSNDGGGKVKVTQQGGNRYTYTIVPGSVTVPGSWADSQLEADLAKQGVSGATVSCPSTIVVKVDTTVTCDVSSQNGVNGQVTFTFSNANGTVDSSSVSEG